MPPKDPVEKTVDSLAFLCLRREKDTLVVTAENKKIYNYFDPWMCCHNILPTIITIVQALSWSTIVRNVSLPVIMNKWMKPNETSLF